MNPARRERWVAATLLVCVGLVAAWMILARHAARGFDPLRLGPEDFVHFQPSEPGWLIRLVFVKATPVEPTITAYEVRRADVSSGVPGADAPVLVRLVHGYNMVDCMRIKHYKVDLLADDRALWRQTETRGVAPPSLGPPKQIWRLKEPDPDSPARVWVSSMLLASDFSGTTVDTRAMAFPRIGTPDDPAWMPTGLRWRSFRHPVRNFRYYLRSRWNASRMDLWTFLRLRRPAWASDVMITMVSEYRGHDASERTEAEMQPQVVAAHQMFYRELRRYAATRN